MSRDRGRIVPYSFSRQVIGNMLAMSRTLPVANAERRIDLRDLRRIVAKCRPRPNWLSIILKAYSLISMRTPRLRQTYLAWPWPRLFEHAFNRASLVFSRPIGGEDTLLSLIVERPEELTLAEIDRRIVDARFRPVEEIPSFRRQIRFSRLPAPIRALARLLGMNWAIRTRTHYLGSFGMSVMANMGVGTLTTFCPLSTMIHFTPFDDAGWLTVRLAYDPRVVDEPVAERALFDLEQVLKSDIRMELETHSALTSSSRSQAA